MKLAFSKMETNFSTLFFLYITEIFVLLRINSTLLFQRDLASPLKTNAIRRKGFKTRAATEQLVRRVEWQFLAGIQCPAVEVRVEFAES